MALRTVGVKLVAEISDYTRNIKQAGKTTADFTGELNEAAKKGKLDAVADQALGMGVALTVAAGSVVKLSMDFEKSMSAVSAATHAGAKDINALRAAAIQAGKDTQYSATEAADAITELSKAGVATSEILGGGLDGALSLAAAGQLGVAEAAETAASAMTQFKLKGTEVPHIADLLAAAAGKAQGSVHDMGYALNQSGLVASQFGLSIEDTTGALAEFANAGLLGSDAGTSFKSMLLAIGNPSDVTANKMQELGVTFYDAKGKFIGLTGVADMLRDKLGQLTEEQRNAALGQIFGSDAVRAATVLYKDGSVGVEKWKNAVNDAGYASQTAADLTDNLAGDIERLKGSLETMAIEAGGGANGGLRVLVKSTEALVDQIGSLPSFLTNTATVLGGVAGAALLLGGGWIKLRRQTTDMLSELREVGPGGAKAATALQGASKWAGRAAAAFAVYEVASTAVAAAQSDLNPQIEALSQGLATYGQTGKLAGESSRVLGDDLGKLEGKFRFLADDGGRAKTVRGLEGAFEALIPGLKGTDESLARTKERITAIDGSLSQLVQGGNASEAQATFDRLAKTLAVDGVSMDEFKKQFPQYAAALETAGTATKKTAGDIDELGNAAGTSSGEVIALSKSMDELFQTQISADRAALKLAESTNDLAAELTKGARTLSLNSEEGRKNRAAILDNLDAIESNRDARVRGGEALDDANKKYLKDIEGLRKSATQAGFSKKAIDELVGAYEDIPSQVNTKVSASNTGPVQTLLDSLLIKQEALKKGISVSAAASAFRKNAYGYHDGGRTAMVGEHEPAGVVHGGEFVFSAASVRKIDAQSPGFLDEAQATGQLPGYADGGRVATWPFPVNAGGTKVPSQAEAMAAVAGDFGAWPSSPGAQRGDSGVWRKIVGLVKSSGIPYDFGNAYRAGDPLWHGSGRAVDFMGYNQDRLANFFMARENQVLELIHRTDTRDYGVTRGHYNAMPTQWPLHRNHLHVAMAGGGVITEPVLGVGASGTTYSFGENYIPERVTPMAGGGGGTGGGSITIVIQNQGVIASRAEAESWLTAGLDSLRRQGRL